MTYNLRLQFENLNNAAGQISDGLSEQMLQMFVHISLQCLTADNVNIFWFLSSSDTKLMMRHGLFFTFI